METHQSSSRGHFFWSFEVVEWSEQLRPVTSVWLGAVRRSVQVRLCTSGCKSEKMFGVISPPRDLLPSIMAILNYVVRRWFMLQEICWNIHTTLSVSLGNIYTKYVLWQRLSFRLTGIISSFAHMVELSRSVKAAHHRHISVSWKTYSFFQV